MTREKGWQTDSPIPDLEQELRRNLEGEVRTDLTSRLLYSTDASIYQIEPLGVAFPRTSDDLAAAVELCARYRVPVLARGAGSSLAGQAVGTALILDCSRYLNHILDIDNQASTATMQPGVVLAALNRAAGKHGLQFGPDPASGERATLGGSIANNASGAHSIRYGMAADHLISAEVVLSDGSPARFAQQQVKAVERQYSQEVSPSRLGEIYRAALKIRNEYTETIRDRWPRVWRRASGYNLNYLLPWSPTSPPQWAVASTESAGQVLPYPPAFPDEINLASLLAGSEGTLAVMRELTVRLVPLPAYTVVGVQAYPGIAEACDAVPSLLEHNPSAIELIPQDLIHMARSVPAYAQQLTFVQGDPSALLAIEFSGSDLQVLREQALSLGPDVLLAETPAQQRQVWGVRKVGMGLLMSRAGDIKPWPFIEDLAVPAERLGEFVREMERILSAYGTGGSFYAHASAGCLHIRPLLNLKTAGGVQSMRSMAAEAVSLTLRLGGSVSGEHGDGLSRSEWLEQMFGEEIIAVFRELKAAADPLGLLNPGKIVDPPPMDANLRFGQDYHAKPWQAAMDFSGQAGLDGAIEQCNGAGVCRKADGVMCPSFQVTQEEMHSTRGRANLLRAMIAGHFPSQSMAERAVYEALDLCLACKGCRAECPSAVDVAKLRYEFLHHYYDHHRRPLRDYLFGYIAPLAKLGHSLAPLANFVLHTRAVSQLAERLAGIAAERPLPRFARQTFRQQWSRQARDRRLNGERVLLLMDAFNDYFYPENGLAAAQALQEAGCAVEVLPVEGAGRTLISKGFLDAARRHTARLVEAIQHLDPEGQLPVVGVEPSEIYTLRDEYADLLPGDPVVKALATRTYLVDEFLVRPGVDGRPRVVALAGQVRAQVEGKVVALHGHCYQKAQPPADDGYPTGVLATTAMLEACGYRVQVVDSGCCGMAGAFGYEAEHYKLSMQVGEQRLFPALRAAPADTIVAAAGISCQEQILDGTGKRAQHPVRLVLAAL